MSFNSTSALQTLKQLKEIGKNTMKGTDKDSFLRFAFCLITRYMGWVLFTSLQEWYVYTKHNYWYLKIRVSMGLVPAVTPRILCYFISFYESHHNIFSLGWHGEWGPFWAGWLWQQCFQQAHGRANPVLQGLAVNPAHSHPLWHRGTGLDISLAAGQDWSQGKLFHGDTYSESLRTFTVFWCYGDRVI